VLRSITKLYGLPGLRLGFGVGAKRLIANLEKFKQPWSVNIFAQAIGNNFLRDKEFIERSKKYLLRERSYLYRELSSIRQLKVYSSHANFLLLRILSNMSSGEMQKRLLKKGILIRDCSNFRNLNDKFIRVAVKKRKDNSLLVEVLKSVLDNKG
jgi:threonine-phosphate decarboxylase